MQTQQERNEDAQRRFNDARAKMRRAIDRQGRAMTTEDWMADQRVINTAADEMNAARHAGARD